MGNGQSLKPDESFILNKNAVFTLLLQNVFNEKDFPFISEMCQAFSIFHLKMGLKRHFLSYIKSFAVIFLLFCNYLIVKQKIMISLSELFYFSLAAFALVMTPGPNMIYLISRAITQGRKAGIISLIGVICGFLFFIPHCDGGIWFDGYFICCPFCFHRIKINGCSLFTLFGLSSNQTE